jgi:6-phosphogluconolactonase
MGKLGLVAEIVTYDAPDQLTKATADLVLGVAKESVRDRGRFVWGLAGGQAPAMLYRLLANKFYAARMPWEETFIFWGDERWVTADDPQSNQRMAFRELLDCVPIPKENIKRIITIGVKPGVSAEAMERQVRTLYPGEPRQDLMLLGLGEDGHTASLFLGTIALLEEDALFAANHVPDLDAWRIAATFPPINAVRNVEFLVSGATKTVSAYRVLYPQPDSIVMPASMVQPSNRKLTWLLDRDTASRLPHAA